MKSVDFEIEILSKLRGASARTLEDLEQQAETVEQRRRINEASQAFRDSQFYIKPRNSEAYEIGKKIDEQLEKLAELLAKGESI